MGKLAVRKAEFASLLAMSSDDLRSLQDRERQAAETAQEKASDWYSLVDRLAGRRKAYTLHLEEGARAFREGEAALYDESKKKQWYARAVVEYRDATVAATGDEAARSSVGQATETAGGAIKQGAVEVAKSAASGLEGLVTTAIIAYFVSQAIQGVARGR